MSEVTREAVESAISAYIDPYLDTDLISAKAVKDVVIDGGKVTVDIELGFPAKGYADTLSEAVAEKVNAVDGVSEAAVNVGWSIVSHAVQKGV
ncbi:MAG: iron-sulfur cluster assembly protein, partial [Gammaproteobacteria bacterium]|nr:iron-sulfur cluster assembly protein [Gammaproteobacteria bacterium]